jgi:hypothetical protein
MMVRRMGWMAWNWKWGWGRHGMDGERGFGRVRVLRSRVLGTGKYALKEVFNLVLY